MNKLTLSSKEDEIKEKDFDFLIKPRLYGFELKIWEAQVLDVEKFEARHHKFLM